MGDGYTQHPEKDMMKFIPAVLLIVTKLATPAYAQTQPRPLTAAANRELVKLESRAPVAVTQAAAGSQPRSWVARHPALTGTLIGLGIGFPIGVATCNYPGGEGSSCAYYTYPSHARMLGGVTIGLFGAGIGAGVGALVGVLTR
jgi:hypothetical protein